MIVIKQNYLHGYLNEHGMAEGNDQNLQGLFYADVRLVKQYQWTFPNFSLLQQDHSDLDTFSQHWSLMHHPIQRASIIRTVRISDNALHDSIEVENFTQDNISCSFQLSVLFDNQDTMTLRGIGKGKQPALVQLNAQSIQLMSSDNRCRALNACLNVKGQQQPISKPIDFVLKKHEKLVIELIFRFSGWQEKNLTELNNWQHQQETFLNRYHDNDKQKTLLIQSIKDLRGLLFTTEQGLVIAAGLPRFAAPFGRDSLITAFLLLSITPDLAKGVLRFLAHFIGTKSQADNDESYGKILHEYRFGPESQSNHIPFAPYFGSADATPLFLMLLTAYCEQIDDWQLANELSRQWQAAYQWLQHALDQGGGWVRFTGNPNALMNQGWKDSANAMCHEDGHSAKGAIAAIEIQGYAYAGLKSAHNLFKRLDDANAAKEASGLAKQMYQRIQTLWDNSLGLQGFYPMGIDGNDQPMRVLSSNVGHLLWCKAVPESYASIVSAQLLSDSLFSGWGIRTLANVESAYNPVSYHNGSVWPHDNALIAWGLLTYGDRQGFQTIKTAIENLALVLPHYRLPELVAGYPKVGQKLPIPYPDTCSPQAWSAAVIPFFCSHSIENKGNSVNLLS